MKKIILINGTSGVGKTTLAMELARRNIVRTLVSTDSIRDILVPFVEGDPGVHPSIRHPSFLAYESSGRIVTDPTAAEILRFFRLQSNAIVPSILAWIESNSACERAIAIEGVNVVTTSIVKEMPPEIREQLVICNISLDSAEENMARLNSRTEQGNDTQVSNDEHIDNIDKIMLIGEYLRKDVLDAIANYPLEALFMEQIHGLGYIVQRIEEACA